MQALNRKFRARVRRLEAGDIVDGRWKIECRLGEGGMGIVFSARHTVIRRRVAIKVLRPTHNQSFAARRFANEARAAAAIDHPNVVQVFDFGKLPDERPYYVMELLEGVLLARLLRQRPLSFDEVCTFGAQIADALARIHEQGLVHRDLTPNNLMLVGPELDRSCKIYDFGIATSPLRRVGRLTPAGRVVGTPAYMSPEQCIGKHVDWRSDLYGLGVLLYVMAMRRLPFEQAGDQQVMRAHVSDRAAQISELASGEPCPGGLARLISTCLAKHPETRIQYAQQLRDELLRLRDAGPLASQRPTLRPPPPEAAPQQRGFALAH